VSELNSTFCRFTITDPGTTPSQPDNRVNQSTDAKPIVPAMRTACLGADGVPMVAASVTSIRSFSFTRVEERDDYLSSHVWTSVTIIEAAASFGDTSGSGSPSLWVDVLELAEHQPNQSDFIDEHPKHPEAD
jgi:hypothetical protein